MLDLIKIREYLHRNPELAFEEFTTQEYILKILNKMSGILIHTFPEHTGILVEYSHDSSAYKLLRADMDALPITEKTNCDFQSERNGVMHACGHDIHMTILLGTIEWVISQRLEQNILFLFQPAEEGKGGARRILDSGILQNFSIKNAFALHVSAKYPLGSIASSSGIFFANTNEIDVEIFGKSAHVAFPKKGINSFLIARLIDQQIDKYITDNIKNKKKLLCTFGKINCGRVRNAIPDYCKMEGTLRALEYDDYLILQKKIIEIADSFEKKFGVKIKVNNFNFYKSVLNNENLLKMVKYKIANSKLRFVEAESEMTGEDFGYFSHLYPSLLVWLGVNVGKMEIGLHSETFLPDQKTIYWGVNYFSQILS